MIGGVSVKEIRRELDRVADRAADQLAEAAARRAAAGVEAGQLDPRVAAHAQRLQLPGELAIGEGVLADHDVSGLLEGASSRSRRRGSRRCRRFRPRSAIRPRCGGSTARGSRWPPAAAGREARSASPSSPVIVKRGRRAATLRPTARPSGTRRHVPSMPPISQSQRSRDDVLVMSSTVAQFELSDRFIHRRRKARSMSRLASCFLIASRLSKVLRPVAMLSSTLAIPFLK